MLRYCYRQLGLLGLDRDVERLVVNALRAAAPGPSRMLLEAGREAGLAHDVLLDRTSVAFLNFAAFNLSDDLSDGECSYLAVREGPAVLLILLSLFQSTLRGLGLPPHVEARVTADLIAAQAAQVVEIATTRWDLNRLTWVTDGIAGKQWSAYLTLMWAGTALEGAASDAARGLGRVALLAGDIRTGDQRYTSLPRRDCRAVIDQALVSACELEAGGLTFIAAPVAASKRTLLSELVRLSADGPDA